MEVSFGGGSTRGSHMRGQPRRTAAWEGACPRLHQERAKERKHQGVEVKKKKFVVEDRHDDCGMPLKGLGKDVEAYLGLDLAVDDITEREQEEDSDTDANEMFTRCNTI